MALFRPDMQKSIVKAAPSTQSFLSIAEVKEDLIITLGGGARAVIAVSSTNFVLKSQDEQNAIIARYQAFLNTLDFSIQILIQSRKLDIHGYLDKVRERQLQQTNELLRVQTEEYAEYIGKLLEYGNIMNKTFFVVIPFSTGDQLKEGIFDKFKNLLNPTRKIVEHQEKLAEAHQVLDDRVARVENGLSGVGLRTMRLNTQELVELLYNSYNLGTAQTGLIDLAEVDIKSNK